MAKFFCGPKPGQERTNTLSVYRRAVWTVRSTLSASTNTISSAHLTPSRQPWMFCSSFFVMTMAHSLGRFLSKVGLVGLFSIGALSNKEGTVSIPSKDRQTLRIPFSEAHEAVRPKNVIAAPEKGRLHTRKPAGSAFFTAIHRPIPDLNLKG